MKFRFQFFTAFLLLTGVHSFAQTNTFPSSGNAGIGTTSPAFPLTVNTTSTNEGVRIGGGTYYLDIMANMSGGGYHPLVGGNTVGIIYKGASENYANSLVIAPWANAPGGGIHMDQYGRVGIGTLGGSNVLKLHGGNNPISGLGSSDNYQLRISHNYNGTDAVSSGIAFGGNNSDGSPSASIYHVQQGQPSYGDLAFATKANGGSMTERLRINANGNIGIGTNLPNNKLEIAGGAFSFYSTTGYYTASGFDYDPTGDNNNGQLRIRANIASDQLNTTQMVVNRVNGNVGIGTSTPSARLHVSNAQGNADGWFTSGTASGQYATLLFGEGSSGGQYAEFIRYSNASSADFRPGDFVVANQTKKIILSTNYSSGYRPDLVVNAAGDVGIGTLSPQSKLSVNGTITSTKLKVLQTGWADYVFDNAYNLPSLQEVEEYIKKHKHLPGIVSAAEVEKEGIDVGDNQAALLKKIEELTLYVIEMNKQLEKQQKRIAELERGK
jgi:hypothetical protein